MKRRKTRRLLPALVLAAGTLASTTVAQTWTGSATLGVSVRSAKGGPLVGALVTIAYREVGFGDGPPPRVTTERGEVNFTGIADGTWSLKVDHPEHLTYMATLVVRGTKKAQILSEFLEATGAGRQTMKVKLLKPTVDSRGSVAEQMRTAEVSQPASPAAPPPAPDRSVSEQLDQDSGDESEAPTLEPQAVAEDAPAEIQDAAAIAEPDVTPEPPVAPATPQAREQIVEALAVPALEASAAPETEQAEPAAVEEPEDAEATPAPQMPDPTSEPTKESIEPPVAPVIEQEATEIAAEEEVKPAAIGEVKPEHPAPPTPRVLPREPASESVEPPDAAVTAAPADAARQAAEAIPDETPDAPVALEAPAAEAEPTTAAVAAPSETTVEEEAVAIPEGPAGLLPAVAQTPAVEMAVMPDPAAIAERRSEGQPDALAEEPVGVDLDSLRSYRDRTCLECRPGEWAVSAAASAQSQIADDCVVDEEGLRRRMQSLAEASGTRLASYGGPLTAELVALPDSLRDLQSGSCRLLSVVLPQGARYTGFRLQAEDHEKGGDCLGNLRCPVGEAGWLFEPATAESDGATIVYGVFRNLSPTRDRTATLTAYFLAPRGWPAE